jgi:intracellular septation protein
MASRLPPDVAPPRSAAPALRLVLEVGPLAAFFLANSRWGIYTGTAVFMAAIVVALIASWSIERRVPILPLVTAVFVLVFGGLTLWLEDSLFIKLKPTIVNGLFALLLLGGLASGRSLIKPVLGASLELDEPGWKRLTLRWALFFVFLAGLNELIWRNFSDDAWVKFKVFGILPLTLLFAMAQIGLIKRHERRPS